MRLPTWDELGDRPGPGSGGTAARIDVGSSAAGSVLGAISQAGSDISGDLQQANQAAQRQREKSDAVTAAKAYSQAEIDWQQKMIDAQNNAAVGAPDFTKSMLEGFDEDVKQRVASAPESARPWIEMRFADLRGNIASHSMAFEAKSRLDKQAGDIGDVVNLQANGVRTNFGSLPKAIGVAEGAIEASSLAPAEKERQRQIARYGITQAAFEGLNETDPNKAKEMLASGKFDGYLSADSKNALVNNNMVELHRREAEAEQQKRLAEADRRAAVADLHTEASFALTALRDGTVYAGFDDLVSRANKLDPKTAGTLQQAKADLGWTTNLLKMAPADILTEIKRTQQDAAKADNPVMAAALANRVQTGEKVLGRVVDQIKQDPLTWAEAQGVVPHTQLDFSKPDQVQARMQAVTRAKATYGVDVPVFKPDEADQFVKRFNSATTPDEKFGLVAQLLQLPGDQAGQALAQLEAAKLPESVRRALDMVRDDPSRVPVARRVLGELSAPPAKAVLTDDDVKTIRKQAHDAYSDGIGGVLAKQYQLTGDAAYDQRIEADSADLEHVVRARSAAGLDKADTTSYADLFGHLEPVSVDDLAQVVVAKGTDADKLEEGFAYLRESAIPQLLEADRPTDKAAARQWEAYHLKPTVTRGVWINSGNGFVLIEPGTGKAVAGADGNPRVWSLQEVMDAAKKHREELDKAQSEIEQTPGYYP